MTEYELCLICGRHANKEYTITTNSSLSPIKRNPQKTKHKYYCSKACNYRETWNKNTYIILEFVFMMSLMTFLRLWLLVAIFFAIGTMILIFINWKRTYWKRETEIPEVPENMWVLKKDLSIKSNT